MSAFNGSVFWCGSVEGRRGEEREGVYALSPRFVVQGRPIRSLLGSSRFAVQGRVHSKPIRGIWFDKREDNANNCCVQGEENEVI